MSEEVRYFRWTAWYYWLGGVFGMTLLGTLALSPAAVPYGSLGVVGDFLHHLAYQHHTLLTVGFGAACVAHLAEGWYAYVLARRMNLTARDTALWTFQTLMLGVSSLLPLRAHYKKTV